MCIHLLVFVKNQKSLLTVFAAAVRRRREVTRWPARDDDKID